MINLEDTGNRMVRLATSITLRNTVTPIDSYLSVVDAIDHAAIRRVA